MREISYTVKDELGLHARPAGILVKEVKKYKSIIFLSAGERQVEASKLMAIMGMAIKCGDNIMLEISGEDEDFAYEKMKDFLETNL